MDSSHDARHPSKIPDTHLTKSLRALWTVLCDIPEATPPTWEEWYADQCIGGTPNGRAVAAVLFDRAGRYWPNFLTPADQPALAVWADLIDRWHPFITPEVIEQAVDAVAAQGVQHPVPGHFTQAAEQIMGRR